MRVGLWVVMLCVLSACTTTGAVARAARAQQNAAVVLAFVDTVFNKHDVIKAFKLYVGPNYRQHNRRAAEEIKGAIEGLNHFTQELYPQLRQEVQRTVAQGDLVAVHVRQMRHLEDRQTGRGEAVIDIFRLEQGKIVEQWEVSEELSGYATNDHTMF